MRIVTSKAAQRVIRFGASAVVAVAAVAGPVMAQGHELSDPEKIAEVEAGRRGTANAAWWGFDPEDSTEAIQAAIDSGASEVIIPNVGEDWIVRPLHLRSNQTVRFEEGVRLMAKEGEFHGRNDSVLSGENIENVRLIGYGATIQMRKEDYMSDAYEDAQWRMCIKLHSCRNVEIKGLTLRESGGDGIYLGNARAEGIRSYNENVLIRDAVCDNNYRQGLSVISARNLLVENSAFNNTSGHGPSAGIDLEPNRPDEELTNVVIRNCMFLDNANLGMHVWFGHVKDGMAPVDVLWENNYVRGSRVGIHVNSVPGGSGRVTYRNNIIEDSEYAGILIIRKNVDGVEFVFENNFLYNTGLADPEGYWNPSAPIVLYARSSPPERQGGIHFENTFIYHEAGDRPMVRLTDAEGFEGWYDVTGTITVSMPGGKAERAIEGRLDASSDLRILP